MYIYLISIIIGVVFGMCYFKKEFWANCYGVLMVIFSLTLISNLIYGFTMRNNLDTKIVVSETLINATQQDGDSNYFIENNTYFGYWDDEDKEKIKISDIYFENSMDENKYQIEKRTVTYKDNNWFMASLALPYKNTINVVVLPPSIYNKLSEHYELTKAPY